MEVIELVLNLAFMSLLLTLGMIGMHILSPGACTVMLGLAFCEPEDEPDGAFEFPVIILSGVLPCICDQERACAAVVNMF